jgi:hypothetical protein
MKLLSRAITIVLCVCLLSGCGISQDELDEARLDEYVDGYDEGYRAGYEDGLWDGAFECKKDFANAVRDRYFDMEGASSNGREFHAEEAIMVLNDYLDGEYVSNAELESAIESISDFYYDWQSVIANIEDMEVDIYFD